MPSSSLAIPMFISRLLRAVGCLGFRNSIVGWHWFGKRLRKEASEIHLSQSSLIFLFYVRGYFLKFSSVEAVIFNEDIYKCLKKIITFVFPSENFQFTRDKIGFISTFHKHAPLFLYHYSNPKLFKPSNAYFFHFNINTHRFTNSKLILSAVFSRTHVQSRFTLSCQR